MWCDTFDADLLAVVPGAADALGPAGEVRLLTWSRLTDGKINCPSCWNCPQGLAAFFWTGEEHQPDESYWWTDDPVAECTFLEAVRDEWVHSCAVAVNDHIVWRPPVRLMEKLMYDLRGWTVLADDERERIRGDVRRSLRSAARRLERVPGVPALADERARGATDVTEELF